MRLIISTMKDEGPFLLEWVAYYLSIGFTHFLINTNDCSDGTDQMLERLQQKGFIRHLKNPGPWERGPQLQAYANAMEDPWFTQAEWILVCDADEFMDIRVGDGTVDALFAACPSADAFAIAWQLFGHNGIVVFEDKFITKQMTRAADPHQCWPQNVAAIKTLFRNNGTYRWISTHRPKGAPKSRLVKYNWVDGDGMPLPTAFKHKGWAFSRTGIGFGRNLVRMNHYAVRSIQSYLMKRLRGDVNTTRIHPKAETSGRIYWNSHCWNTVEERSILPKLPRAEAIFRSFMADPEMSALHRQAVAYHRARIDDIIKQPVVVNFIHRYQNHKGNASAGFLQDNVLVDENSSFSVETIGSKAKDVSLCDMIREGRLLQTRQCHSSFRKPWFVNMDALATPLEISDIEKQLTAQSDWRPPFDVHDSKLLPQLDEETGKARRQRQTFIQSLGRKTSWALIGAFEPYILRELLAYPHIRRLYMIEPWGMKWNEMDVETVQIDPDRVELDKRYFAFITHFETEIRNGDLRVYRALPITILKLFRPQSVGVVAIKGHRRETFMQALMTRADRILEPGGAMIFTAYKKGGLPAQRTAAAIHRYLGQNASRYRIMAREAPWLGIQKLPEL